MLRFLEILLFLAPFVAFVSWRLLEDTNGPSPAMLGAAAGAVLVIGAALLWFGLHDAEAPDTPYIPAQLRHGQIVPGHATGH